MESVEHVHTSSFMHIDSDHPPHHRETVTKFLVCEVQRSEKLAVCELVGGGHRRI